MITSDEAKIRLTAIRENLPPQYSISAARRLMSSYENYKHIVQELGQSYAGISAAMRAALPEIESAIRQAIKGTPKSESEQSFRQAKQQMTGDINGILLAGGGQMK